MNDEKSLKDKITRDLCKKIIKIIYEDKGLKDTGYECGIISNICCFILGSICITNLKEDEYNNFFKYFIRDSIRFKKLTLGELNEGKK